MQLTLTLRDLQPEDLGNLAWAGGPEHLTTLASYLPGSASGVVVLLVAALSNGELVGHGLVDLRGDAGTAMIEQLAVRDVCQRLGVGTWLVSALEDRLRERGVGAARLAVEHDNPGAAALYERLGYREIGSLLQTWPAAAGRRYVTVSSLLEKRLVAGPQ